MTTMAGPNRAKRMSVRLRRLVGGRMRGTGALVGVVGVFCALTGFLVGHAVASGFTVDRVGPLAAWVGAGVTATAVWFAVSSNRDERRFFVNRQAARAVADLWAAVVAVRRPLAAFSAVASGREAFVDGVPSQELDRISGEVQEALTDVESAAFFARLVIDEGFVLGYVEEVAALLRELRQFFEEGGDVPSPGPHPPGGEPVPPSVEMWLTDLDEKLRHVMVVEETFVESVRYFFPVSDGQQVSANSINLKKLQQEAYVRVKASRHSSSYRRAQGPAPSWRTRWR